MKMAPLAAQIALRLMLLYMQLILMAKNGLFLSSGNTLKAMMIVTQQINPTRV